MRGEQIPHAREMRAGRYCMQLAKMKEGACVTVKLSGELDHHNAAITRERLDKLISNGAMELTLDMSEVTFMDSSGIGVILGRYRRMKERGGKLVISGCSGNAQRILKMAGVFSIVERR